MDSAVQDAESIAEIIRKVSNRDFDLSQRRFRPSGRIIVVSYVLPYESLIDRDSRQWDLKNRRGTSALYSSIRWLGSETLWDVIHIGWTGELAYQSAANVIPSSSSKEYTSCRDVSEDVRITRDETVALDEAIQEKGKPLGIQYLPIWLPEDFPASKETLETQSRWRHYGEQVIWPLLHYTLWQETNGQKELEWWKDYLTLNTAFANKICHIYKPGDIIWIHDYHLSLLPEIVRQRIPDATIYFFLHAPFPSSEYFRCLPKRQEVLSGILGSTMIGFQTHSYARHFISSCTRVMGLESDGVTYIDFGNTRVSIFWFPIGINANRVELALRSEEITKQASAISAAYNNKKVIVGRDRLDEIRGVMQKLRGFELFFEMYPEWRDRAVLIQVTSPAQWPQKSAERKVSEMIAHINGKYGSLDFAPVQHFHHHLDEDQYFALLRVADVGLITSIRDGLNTMGLEYVVAQKENKGPIILSEFTGTSQFLVDALHINPWDTKKVAETLHRCLTMGEEERERRSKSLYKYVTMHTVQAWTSLSIHKILQILEEVEQSQCTPIFNTELCLQAYVNSKRRLLLFDYDGTLSPIVRDPAAAIPSSKLLRALEALTSDQKNIVWIISGRDQKFLDTWIGSKFPTIGLSAEHGSFLKYPNEVEWVNLIEGIDMSWQDEVLRIYKYYTDCTEGSMIEQKRCALTWHYRRADPEFGAFRAQELQNHLDAIVLPKFDIEIMTGKANIEVRPRNINKGEIVKRLMDESSDFCNFVLCAGDDKTDEDMFRQLRRKDSLCSKTKIFGIMIGPASKRTLASWHLRNPNRLIHVLEQLIEHDANANYPNHIDRFCT